MAEELRDHYSTPGVLVVDAQGHGIISAKIAFDGARHVP